MTKSTYPPMTLAYQIDECPLTQNSFEVHLAKHNHNDAFYLARAKLDMFNHHVNEMGQDWLYALRGVSKSYFFHMGLGVAAKRGRHIIYFKTGLREAIKDITDLDVFDNISDVDIFKHLCYSNDHEFQSFALQYEIIVNSILYNNKDHPLVCRLEASRTPVQWLEKYASGNKVWIEAQFETARLEGDKPFAEYKFVDDDSGVLTDE